MGTKISIRKRNASLRDMKRLVGLNISWLDFVTDIVITLKFDCLAGENKERDNFGVIKHLV
jgi:hypothetical protein